MAYESLSSNMNLPIPGVGLTGGPTYAIDLNVSLTIIDGHDHTTGFGVPVPSAGLNINTDLSFNTTNAYLLRSVRFVSQVSPISLPADLGCLSVSGQDLYYNDFAGNQIRITESGGVAGTPGSIGGLTSPASATYVSVSQTFVFKSASTTPATIDGGSFIFRNISASSNGITVSPPAGLGSNYSLTLPSLPASQKFMTLTELGVIAAPWSVDNSTLVVDSNVLKVPTGGITFTQLATDARIPAGAIVPFGGTSAPTGWLFCNGASVLRATYPDLFTVIGTAYGTADGTHFNLPDGRGYFLRGTSSSTGRDPDASSRTAANTGGNTGDNVGSVQTDALDTHVHEMSPHNHLSNRNDISGATFGNGFSATGVSGGTVANQALCYTSDADPEIQATGGNETRPINLYVNFIIKT